MQFRTVLPRVSLLACAFVACLPAQASDPDKNPAIVYRQSLMELIGANVGPMFMMNSGKIPWDDARVAAYGKDIRALAGLNAMRGFPPGSDTGDTHAKPEIWKNMDDFQKKMEDMQTELVKLSDAIDRAERQPIVDQLGIVGKNCKSCHDDYKEKEAGE